MKQVGYLLNTRDGLEGEPGFFYNYILAGNGLFIRADGPLVSATVCVALAEVRGLAPMSESVELARGKIPMYFYELAISTLYSHSHKEQYLAVVWDRRYRLMRPQQEGTGASVKYNRLPHTVLDIHSHSGISAFFSSTDNNDEQGLRLYMVVGQMDKLIPEVELRIGVYGYYATLDKSEVFGVQAG